MRISLIAAVSENGVIGKDGKLPWSLPADLEYFKQITSGNPIIMGRATYESIGRPLPKRTNIVLTRQRDFSAPGCIVVYSPEQALETAQRENCDEVFVIGGEQVYRAMSIYIERAYLTVVHEKFDGDTYFPEGAFNSAEWRLVLESPGVVDDENPHPHTFAVFDRV